MFGIVGVVIGEESLNSWRIVVCAVCCLFSGFEGRKRFLGCRGSGFCRNIGFGRRGWRERRDAVVVIVIVWMIWVWRFKI